MIFRKNLLPNDSNAVICLYLPIKYNHFKTKNYLTMKTKNPVSKLIVLIFIALATSMTFSSCKDECKDVDCQNGGYCENGDCICASGYEGDNCATAMADKFVGTWKYNESCGGANVSDWPVTISKSTANKISITGFGGFQCSGGVDIIVTAIVNGRDLNLESNQLNCAGDLTINSGSGSLSSDGKTLNITYTYTVAGVGQETCSGIYTKI